VSKSLGPLQILDDRVRPRLRPCEWCSGSAEPGDVLCLECGVTADRLDDALLAAMDASEVAA
jgi:hypothetical protein